MEDEDEQYMEQDAGKTAGSSMAQNVAGTQGEPSANLGDMQAQFQQMMLLMQGQAQANTGEPDKNAPLFNINTMMMGQQSQSMDRQEKRKLMNEIKDEMKIMIT